MLAKSGQSIGKKLTKIKIVDAESGEKVSLMRAFTLRSFIYYFEFAVYAICHHCYHVFAIGEKRQTLHDKLAKTKVIKQ